MLFAAGDPSVKWLQRPLQWRDFTQSTAGIGVGLMQQSLGVAQKYLAPIRQNAADICQPKHLYHLFLIAHRSAKQHLRIDK